MPPPLYTLYQGRTLTKGSGVRSAGSSMTLASGLGCAPWGIYLHLAVLRLLLPPPPLVMPRGEEVAGHQPSSRQYTGRLNYTLSPCFLLLYPPLARSHCSLPCPFPSLPFVAGVVVACGRLLAVGRGHLYLPSPRCCHAGLFSPLPCLVLFAMAGDASPALPCGPRRLPTPLIPPSPATPRWCVD